MKGTFSAFNDQATEPVPVFNTGTSWHGLATTKAVERATQQVVAAVKEGTKQLVGKSATGVRASDRIVKAVERTGDKIVSAIGKVNNEAEASAAIGAIYGCVADALREVADFVNAHPGVTPDKIQDFNSQLAAMIRSVDTFGEANRLMDYASETLGWHLHAAAREENSNDFTELYNSAGSHHIHTANSGGEVRAFNSFHDIFVNQKK